MRIQVQTDSKSGESYLRLKDFKKLVNIRKVKFYTLEAVNDEQEMALVLKFYDKNGNVVEAK